MRPLLPSLAETSFPDSSLCPFLCHLSFQRSRSQERGWSQKQQAAPVKRVHILKAQSFRFCPKGLLLSYKLVNRSKTHFN